MDVFPIRPVSGSAYAKKKKGSATVFFGASGGIDIVSPDNGSILSYSKAQNGSYTLVLWVKTDGTYTFYGLVKPDSSLVPIGKRAVPVDVGQVVGRSAMAGVSCYLHMENDVKIDIISYAEQFGVSMAMIDYSKLKETKKSGGKKGESKSGTSVLDKSEIPEPTDEEMASDIAADDIQDIIDVDPDAVPPVKIVIVDDPNDGDVPVEDNVKPPGSEADISKGEKEFDKEVKAEGESVRELEREQDRDEAIQQGKNLPPSRSLDGEFTRDGDGDSSSSGGGSGIFTLLLVGGALWAATKKR